MNYPIIIRLFRSNIKVGINLKLLAFICILFIGSSLHGQVLTSDIPSIDISKEVNQEALRLGLITDTTGTWGVEVLSEMPVDAIVPHRFKFKSEDEYYWFVLKLRNPTEKLITKVLRFDELYMETVSLYYQEEGAWEEFHSGTSVMMEDRQVKNRCPVFMVDVPPQNDLKVYIRVHSDFLTVAAFFVEDVPAYLSYEQWQIAGYWLFFGAALALLIYNFFLWLSLRDRLYLYYCSYTFSFIFFSCLYSGFYLYVLDQPYEVQYDLDASMAFSMMFMTLFIKELLQIKKYLPVVNRILTAFVFGFVVFGVMIVVDIRWFMWFVYAIPPILLFYLVVGFMLWHKGNALAKYYLLATSSYLLGLILIALLNLDLVPYNFFTRYSNLMGALLEMLLFSLALAFRVKLLQRERNNYQGKLLAVEQETKKSLERQVALRTKELEDANIEMSLQRDELKDRNENIEILLKEIHHRVKNNLQVVSSLLDLQSRNIEDEKALSTFMEGQNRVKAMALIHQKLYQNENLATIDFEDYAKNLMSELSAIYPAAKAVQYSIKANGNTQFDIDTAIPLGLMLNELISNAYKYAFAGADAGVLSITIDTQGEGKHSLVVSDSGSGLPEGFNLTKPKSLGLRLVGRLAKQLYGSLEYYRDEGTHFRIHFLETQLRKSL